MTTCAACRRDLPIGTTAWARDWTVLNLDGTYGTRTDYVCDDCEGE